MKSVFLVAMLAAALPASAANESMEVAPAAVLRQGELLVRTGGGKTVACAACHGRALKGAFSVPGLLGRAPEYIADQLAAIQSGRRDGPAIGLMKLPVQNLTRQDMLAIGLYLASLPP